MDVYIAAYRTNEKGSQWTSYQHRTRGAAVNELWRQMEGDYQDRGKSFPKIDKDALLRQQKNLFRSDKVLFMGVKYQITMKVMED